MVVCVRVRGRILGLWCLRFLFEVRVWFAMEVVFLACGMFSPACRKRGWMYKSLGYATGVLAV